MKKKHVLILASLATLMWGCQNNADAPEKSEQLIERHTLSLNSDVMTPEVLWAMGRLGDPQVSPDGKQVLYGVSYYSVPQNKSNRELYTISVEGGTENRLTTTALGEYAATWHPDGETIYFLSSDNGTMQLMSMNIDGTNRRQVSDVSGNISGYKISPDGKKVLYVLDVKVDKNTADIYPDLPLADGKIIDDLMYRHWDRWEDGAYSHIFIADILKGELVRDKDIMNGEAWDTPLQPFGGIEEINWSPDSKKVAYTCKKLKGKEYALSTNSDIYVYNIEDGSTQNLTDGMPGYDRQPLFSPDGTQLAWLSMERAGFEADKDRLYIQDLKSGDKRYLTANFDHSPSSLTYSPDGQKLWFVSGVFGTHQIFNIDVRTTKINQVTKGLHDYHNVALAGKYLIGSKVSMQAPEDIFRIDPVTGTETAVTAENKAIVSQLTMGNIEKRIIKSTDNKDLYVWVIYPPHFDANKKYPAILYCQGGPQSPVSQYWSYRWNWQMMAANGYIVVAPARRGVTTYGQEWTDQISKDNGGQEMRDLLTAIDVIKEEPYVDEENIGAIGASYGGYTVYWLAGHHEGRFKAFIAHCGVFNSEMEFSTTEEMFFDTWEKGGAPWEKGNVIAQRSYANSPHNFVQLWDTPILVIHGQNDFRIPYTQGMAAFNSAQLRGIPSRFLFFPTENHWVLKPQNGILWQRIFKDWLDKNLKH